MAPCGAANPARQRPAGHHGLGKWYGDSEASGDAAHGKAVGKTRARATQLFWNPSEREASIGKRLPKGRLPSIALVPVDGLRIGEVCKNSRRHPGDDMVALACHDRYFYPFPARVRACGHFIGPWWGQAAAMASWPHMRVLE
jgi:hypothetical protein